MVELGGTTRPQGRPVEWEGGPKQRHRSSGQPGSPWSAKPPAMSSLGSPSDIHEPSHPITQRSHICRTCFLRLRNHFKIGVPESQTGQEPATIRGCPREPLQTISASESPSRTRQGLCTALIAPHKIRLSNACVCKKLTLTSRPSQTQLRNPGPGWSTSFTWKMGKLRLMDLLRVIQECPSHQNHMLPPLQNTHKMAMTTALTDYSQLLNILQVYPGHKNKETSASQPCRLGLRPLSGWKPLSTALIVISLAFSIFREAF